MSIVVIGRITCTICGRTLEQGKEIIGFPAFTVNEIDPLAFFSDASFHIRCFEEHRSSAKVRQRMAEREKKVGPEIEYVTSVQHRPIPTKNSSHWDI